MKVLSIRANTRKLFINGSLLFCLLATFKAALAHHSYALFKADTATVQGSIAKLEWVNPHTFLWVYVPRAGSSSEYDLYAFENGAPNVLAQRGWSKDMFNVGESVSIEYWPLKDGRTGGHLTSVTRSDGSVLKGVGGPRGAEGNLDTDAAAAAKP